MSNQLTDLKKEILGYIKEHRSFPDDLPIEAERFASHSWTEVLQACAELQQEGAISYSHPHDRVAYLSPTDEPGYNGVKRILTVGDEQVILITSIAAEITTS